MFNEKELELIKSCQSLQGQQDVIRYSVNYPTQSSASSVAALVGEKICKKINELKWDMSLGAFIHDCEEGSFNTDLLLEIFEEYPKLAENYPYETYGLPMSIDIEIGVCGGPGLVEFKRPRGKLVFVENGVLEAKFEGESQYVDKLFAKIGEKYNIEFIDVKEEGHYQSWSEMYQKVASSYHSRLGKTVQVKEGKVKITKKEKILVYHGESCCAFWSTEHEFEKMQVSADGQLCVIIDSTNPDYLKMVEQANNAN